MAGADRQSSLPLAVAELWADSCTDTCVDACGCGATGRRLPLVRPLLIAVSLDTHARRVAIEIVLAKYRDGPEVVRRSGRPDRTSDGCPGREISLSARPSAASLIPGGCCGQHSKETSKSLTCQVVVRPVASQSIGSLDDQPSLVARKCAPATKGRSGLRSSGRRPPIRTQRDRHRRDGGHCGRRRARVGGSSAAARACSTTMPLSTTFTVDPACIVST